MAWPVVFQAICGSGSGMDELIRLSRQATQIVLVAVSILFFVGLVVNVAQAQLATATGDHAGYAHALQQAVALVILISLAAALPALGEGLSSSLSCAGADSATSIALWKALGKLVVSIVVGGAGVMTTLALVWSMLGVQVSQALGERDGVSRGFMRLLVLLGGGILTLSAVLLANMLLNVVWH